MAAERRVEQNRRHLFVKRGVFYCIRRVPKTLQKRSERSPVVMCLHTRNLIEANKAANRITVQLDVAWNQCRLEAMGIGIKP